MTPPMIMYVAITNVWQRIRLRVYFFGSFISDAIGKKPGVPANEKMMLEMAAVASWKLGDAVATTPGLNTTPSGTWFGLPSTPTAMVTVRIPAMSMVMPNQVIHDRRSRVWMEEMAKTITAETNTNTTVHVPCSVMALKAVAEPRRPAPAINVRYSQYITPKTSRRIGPPKMYPTSAMVYTCGCAILNIPTIQSVQLIKIPITKMMTMPGPKPKTTKFAGCC